MKQLTAKQLEDAVGILDMSTPDWVTECANKSIAKFCDVNGLPGGWQPIETVSSELGERVLVVKDCGEGTLSSISLAFHLNDGEWYFDSALGRTLGNYGYRVTHWMPLPAPPKV